MPARRKLASLPRSTLLLLYALAALPHAAATYRGVKVALGMRSERGVRTLVRRAELDGWVEVTRPDPLGKAHVRLSRKATVVLAAAFHLKPHERARAHA